jgi:hypothetical protein
MDHAHRPRSILIPLSVASSTDLCAPSATRSMASLLVMSAGLFVLDGCQAIKGIFEAGFGIGIVVVVAIVAVVGGVIAMVSRRRA